MDTIYDVSGSPVITSTVPPKPFNPLRRPKVNYQYFKIALGIFLLMEILLTILVSGWQQSVDNSWLRLVFIDLAAACIYISLIAKRSIIWLVHWYQSKAPAHIRLQCVFAPSCSEYMILAVERYGTIRGVIKGLRRLWRCHWPNGGFDWP